MKSVHIESSRKLTTPNLKTQINAKPRKHVSRRRQSLKGGVVIATGVEGCVFKPALACVDSDVAFDNYVTKVGKTKVITKEWLFMTFIQAAIQEAIADRSLTDPDKYFIFPETICKPILPALTTAEFESFSQNCIVKNPKLQNDATTLMALQIPYGGKTVLNFIVKTQKQVIVDEFLDSMKMLLTNGIVPLNAKGVIHGDIKNNNVVYGVRNLGDTKKYVRLIDWGLSINFKAPLQFLNYRFQSSAIQPIAYSFMCLSVKTALDTAALLKTPIEKVCTQLKLMCSNIESDTMKYLVLNDNAIGVWNNEQIDRVMAKFYINFKFNWDEYAKLLQFNYDVYGWLQLIAECVYYFDFFFSDSHLYDVYRRQWEMKFYLKKYMLNSNVLVEKYDINLIINEMRPLFSKRKLNEPTALPTCQW